MNNSELRAAVELLKRYFAGESYQSVYTSPPGPHGQSAHSARDFTKDRDLLCQMAIAEHSDQPVTAEWLESVLGPETSHPIDRTGVTWLVDGKRVELWNPEFGVWVRVDNRTQGDVLALLRWLRVPLVRLAEVQR